MAIYLLKHSLPSLNTLTPLFLSLSQAVLKVISHRHLQLPCGVCPDNLNQLKTFTFQGHFDFEEQSKSCTVPDPENKVDGDTLKYFYEPPFQLDGTWQQQTACFIRPHKYEKEDLKNYLRKWQEWISAVSEGRVSWGLTVLSLSL